MRTKKAKKLLAGIVSAAIAAGTALTAGIGGSISADSDQNYGEALAMSLYFFDANECGTQVDDNPLTWRGNCHTYDSEASLSQAQGLSSASLSAIKQANGGSDKVDVSGGFHDAGDHVKFTMTMGFAATSLAWSYFTYPDSYKETGSEAHLMDILKKMCDYFMKVTYLDASGNVICFCYQVADGGTDHNVTWESPEKQTYERTTFWADASHPSGDTSGQMASALAACSLAFADKDSSYSKECLKYANALQKFTAQYPGATYDGVGSFYASGSQKDDTAWAELWCQIANNGGKLPASYNPTYKSNGSGVYNGSEYDCWIYSWDKLWGGYAALLAEMGYDKSTYINELKYELSNSGGLPVGTYNAKGWGSSRYNCALQKYALQIADGNPDDSFAKGAKWQMDYILGSNQKNTSFLLGYGSTYPSQLHHRAANPNKTGASHVCYGSLVGGPTDSSCTYTDYWDQYQSTEPALDYNGCFALACAGLYDLYGGDASVLNDVIKAAPEINENYVFGSWYAGNDPQPVTEPITEPITEPVTEPITEPPTQPTTQHDDDPKPDNVYDINQDSVINSDDVICLSMYLTKQYEIMRVVVDPAYSGYNYVFDPEYLDIGNGRWRISMEKSIDFDLNGDGTVNVYDLVALKRFVSSLSGHSITLVD